MRITIAGRHMEVSDAIRAYAEEKIGKAARIHDSDDMLIEVRVSVEKNPANRNRSVAEVTAFAKGFVVRAEEAAPDLYEAIDLVAEKLEGQMRKYKTRILSRRAKGTLRVPSEGAAPIPILAQELEGESEGALVRTKSVEVRPMSEDEAILQLELLGHDFFVFLNAETENVNVMYRRRDGDFGLIQPSA